MRVSTIREIGIFVGGIMLGILGNLFAEFYLAYVFPRGISESDALWYMFFVSVVIVIELVCFVILIKSKSD